MWRAVARKAACLGTASWLLDAVRSAALADVQLHLPVNHCATATEEGMYCNSAPDLTPSSKDKRMADSAPGKSQLSSGPPAALREGTHFAVLSGVDGSSSKLGSVAAAMRQADVVLLGEYHDDAVAHALQLALLKHVADRLGYTARAASHPPPGPQPQQQRDNAQKQEEGAEGRQHVYSQHMPPPQQAAAEPLQSPPARPLILSLELFETDVQEVLAEYLAGSIRLSDLLKDGRAWSNYMHDYHHLVELCKQLRLPVVAANAPRRYVSLAGRAGSAALLQLPAGAKQWLPPLPHAPPSEAYTRKVQQQMQQVSQSTAALRQQPQQQTSQQSADSVKGPSQQMQRQQQHQEEQDFAAMDITPAQQPHSPDCPYIGLNVSSNFLAAQTLWDATMAYSIARALQHHPGMQPPAPLQDAPASAAHEQASVPSAAHLDDGGTSRGATGSTAGSSGGQGPLVVHVCGKFHCEERLGIPEHLAVYAPGAKVLTVVFTPHDNLAPSADEAQASGLLGVADYVVLTDNKLPRSFTVEHPV